MGGTIFKYKKPMLGPAQRIGSLMVTAKPNSLGATEVRKMVYFIPINMQVKQDAVYGEKI